MSYHLLIQEIWQNPKSALITFGQPRVGDQEYAALHDKHIGTYKKLRFVNNRDPVPAVPLYYCGFVHHSRYESALISSKFISHSRFHSKHNKMYLICTDSATLM